MHTVQGKGLGWNMRPARKGGGKQQGQTPVPLLKSCPIPGLYALSQTLNLPSLALRGSQEGRGDLR